MQEAHNCRGEAVIRCQERRLTCLHMQTYTVGPVHHAAVMCTDSNDLREHIAEHADCSFFDSEVHSSVDTNPSGPWTEDCAAFVALLAPLYYVTSHAKHHYLNAYRASPLNLRSLKKSLLNLC